MKRAAVALVINHRIDQEPNVLAVTNRRFGGWSLPGGKVEGIEYPRDTLVRELREEVDLDTDRDQLELVVTAPNVVGGEEAEVWVYLVLAASGTNGEPHDVEEGTTHAWLRWWDLLPLSPFRAFYERHFPKELYPFRETALGRRVPGRPGIDIDADPRR